MNRQPILFDSHTHLSFPNFDKDREAVIKRAEDAGVRFMIVVGCGQGLEGNKKALALAQAHPNIWATVGLHPHEAQETHESCLQEIQNMATQEKVVAIGEMGLDYYYGKDTRKEQEVLLRKQIQLARS